MIDTCPLCGSDLRDRSFAVDLDSNHVTVCGVKFKTSPQETEFLARLDRSRGEVVSTDEVIRAIWGAGDVPVGADQIVSKCAQWVRRFLEPFGVKIESGPYHGYRLVLK